MLVNSKKAINRQTHKQTVTERKRKGSNEEHSNGFQSVH